MTPGDRVAQQEARAQLRLARYKGEGEGRTLGRIVERKLIVDWLYTQGDAAHALALLIESGIHTRGDVG